MSGTRVPLGEHRDFVRVSEPVFVNFHRRWRAIDRLWPACGDPEYFGVVSQLRNAARDELRDEIRRDARFSGGDYLIPV